MTLNEKVKDASFSSESSERPRDNMMQEQPLTHSLILLLSVITVHYAGIMEVSLGVIYCFTTEISNQGLYSQTIKQW